MATQTQVHPNATRLTDTRPTPIARFKEMMVAHQSDMNGRINKLVALANDLEKSQDQHVLDQLSTVHKIISSMRADQISLQNSWEHCEKSVNW